MRRRLHVDDDYTVSGLLGFGVFDRAADPVLAELTAHAGRRGIPLRVQPVRAPMFSHALDAVADLPAGPRRLWVVPVMGTAVMAYYAHMACLLGAQAPVLAGSAGGLAAGMVVGDLVVPREVTGNDSTALYARHGRDGVRQGRTARSCPPTRGSATPRPPACGTCSRRPGCGGPRR